MFRMDRITRAEQTPALPRGPRRPIEPEIPGQLIARPETALQPEKILAMSAETPT